jgi:phosphatidate phosphatase APP1
LSIDDIRSGLRGLIRIAGRPARRVFGKGDVVLQPYRGYGSTERAFMIGRVFRQRSDTPAKGPGDVWRMVRDVRRRLVRRPVRGVLVRGVLHGVETTSETDRDGYFRLDWSLHVPAPTTHPWREAAPVVEGRGLKGSAPLEGVADIYFAPSSARFAVISDIDDTVMWTGVANKMAMAWRLFAQSAESRTAFPGVSALYRALHDGASREEGNPMLYVSRAPWGIYDILDEFFSRHGIPVPILFLREWGVSLKRPWPRKAEDHKKVLIEAIMNVYSELPVVLIGDSGQHDPEIYLDVVRRFPGRVLAVYIRDVSLDEEGERRDMAAIGDAVRVAGSEQVVAPDTLAMAEHAARLGLIAPEAVAAVAARQPQDPPSP